MGGVSVTEPPVQSVTGPLTPIVGLAGAAFTVTANVCMGDEPHKLFAVTAMLPPTKLAVVVIVVVVDVPVQPLGNVQV